MSKWRGTWKILLAIIAFLCAGVCPTDKTALRETIAGKERLSAGEYGAAIAHFSEARRRLPNDDALRLLAAQAHVKRNEGGIALALLSAPASFRRSVRDPDWMVTLSEAYSVTGKSAAARIWLERALHLDPLHRESHLRMASLAEQAGDRRLAIRHLRIALMARPRDAEAAYRIGLLLLDLEPQQAWEMLSVAARLKEPAPAVKGARHLLAARCDVHQSECAKQVGWELMKMGELRPALNLFELAIAQDPVDAVAHAYRGHILALLGRPALDTLRLSIYLEPNLVLGHYFLGRYYQSLGLSRTARVEFERVLQLDPDNPAVGIDIAYTYVQDGRYDIAEQWVEAAMERAPSDPTIALARARFYVEHAYKLETRGLTAIEWALVLQPDSGEAHDLRGWAWYLMGDAMQATDELRRAVELDPTWAPARLHLGIALLALQYTEEGRRELSRAIDLAPQSRYADLARKYLANL